MRAPDCVRDTWRTVVSSVLFPLHERLKWHDTVAVLRRLEGSQWQSTQRIEEDAMQRLRRFLQHANGRVPYYRKLFRDHDFEPSRLASVEDLAVLPLLDKATIRANTERLRAEGATGLRPFHTGGSSGEPLTFYLSRERVSHDVAAKWRAMRWWGVDIGDPEIVLWGSPIELGGQDRVKQVRDWLFRTRLLPAFAMSDANMERFLRIIARTRPRMLFGYPSALALLAERAAAQAPSGLKDDRRVTFCTGERLYPAQRERIERVFGGRVANGYGGRDAGFIAHECPEGGLHLSAEDVIVELVDADGQPVPNGESGEIVVTHMDTSDFPFIRYRTGDVARRASTPCPCGRGLPALAEIEGRATDFVVAADGTRMHGLALIYVLREQPGVAAFRIEQHSRVHTTVSVVPEAGCPADLDTAVALRFRERLGGDVRVDVKRVDEIPPERSGKYRYVVSHVTEADLAPHTG